MLRYVKIDEYPFVMGPSSSAKLENLLTLKSVVARDEWDVKLPHFPRIRKLGILIDKKINWEALAHLMSKLEHLHSLRVYTNLVYTDDEGSKYPCLNPAFRNYKQVYSLYLQFRWPEDVLGGFSQLPSNLVKLTLLWSCLEQDPMPELEKLPSLRVRRLLDDSYKGRQLVCSKGGFKCLQQLKLRDLENLIELKVEEGAMPNLNQLEISDCDRLNVVPGLQCFTNLPELKFYRTCHMTSV
ncbi:Disease resistance protein (CC-NBS-LRR class) family [Rhynchospora pubera]|uniref:Disease resistance protein (CC-NBS-LRR class) family n=1 Tax=Rhynchospora pubera TaxID=906938 RepID=A0AAV8F4J7_9POAL|nr:Disease resistance protein (CC-NBS-LRR class) family [Rhynchospora pubera]